jgi:two-component sensor histidine kinase
LILHKILNRLLDSGTDNTNTPHELRRIRTTNLLNLVVALYMLISYTKYFILEEHFNPLPSTLFLALALISLLLGRYKKTRSSFILFAVNVNLSVLFFNLHYPPEAGAYLFYFPLAVSAILLNIPTLKQQLSMMYPALFIAFFLINIFVDIPALEMQGLSEYQTRTLWYYDLLMAVMVTLILSFILVKLITDQTTEIMDQNESLIKTKEALNVSLKEKEILLAELHHRIKNNLAIISGLLNLQIDSTTSEEVHRIISDSKNRIQSMALVHKMLFESPLKNIDLAKYTGELIYELFYSYNLTDRVNIIQEYDNVVLPVSKSIPLGLILNEIVTNSIKYVYRPNPVNGATFSISLKEKDNKMVMITIQDNGKGFPKNFNEEDHNSSLGIFLIKSLAEQIDGTVKFSNDNGAKIELNFACN